MIGKVLCKPCSGLEHHQIFLSKGYWIPNNIYLSCAQNCDMVSFQNPFLTFLTLGTQQNGHCCSHFKHWDHSLRQLNTAGDCWDEPGVFPLCPHACVQWPCAQACRLCMGLYGFMVILAEMFLSSVSRVLGHDSWLPIKDRAHSGMKLLLGVSQ